MIKVTKKELLDTYKCFSCGYCKITDFEARGFRKVYYNSGVYGWNWNGYVRGNDCVLTGYRGFDGPAIVPIKSLDDIARYYGIQNESLNEVLGN